MGEGWELVWATSLRGWFKAIRSPCWMGRKLARSTTCCGTWRTVSFRQTFRKTNCNRSWLNLCVCLCVRWFCFLPWSSRKAGARSECCTHMKYELRNELSLYKEKRAVNELWILRAYIWCPWHFPGNEVRLAQKYFSSYHRTELTARRYGVLVRVYGLTSTLIPTRQIIPTQSQTH